MHLLHPALGTIGATALRRSVASHFLLLLAGAFRHRALVVAVGVRAGAAARGALERATGAEASS